MIDYIKELTHNFATGRCCSRSAAIHAGSSTPCLCMHLSPSHYLMHDAEENNNCHCGVWRVCMQGVATNAAVQLMCSPGCRYSCPAGACACGRPVALPRLLASVTSVSRPCLLCPSRSSSKEMAPAPNSVTMMLPPYANTATSSPWQQQQAAAAGSEQQKSRPGQRTPSS
jgi:hypothetical protein